MPRLSRHARIPARSPSLRLVERDADECVARLIRATSIESDHSEIVIHACELFLIHEVVG